MPLRIYTEYVRDVDVKSILNVPHPNGIYASLIALTSAVLLTQVGKPPDVAQSHRVPDDAEEKLHLARPGRPVRFISVDNHMLLLHHLRVVQGGTLWRG